MRSSNKLKSLKYLLVATSSLIALNSSITAYGIDRLTSPHNNLEDNRFQQISYTTMLNDWENNIPQNNDNIILLANGSIVFNTDLRIGTINLYGNMGDTIYITTSKDIKIGNIVNDTGLNAINAVTAANQNIPLNPGVDLNPTIDLVLQSQGIVLGGGGQAGGGLNNSKLTITGNDISAVRSIDVRGSTLQFDAATTIDAKIFGGRAGRITAGHDITFNNVIGKDNNNAVSGIGLIQIRDNKAATLKNDLYGGGVADVIFDSAQARMVIDPSNRNIQISSTFNTTFGEKDDDRGVIEIRGHQNNTVHFVQDVGSEDNRISKITVARGKETQFQNLVFAKKIEIDQNSVLFNEDVDMLKRQEPVLVLQQRAQQQVVIMQNQNIMAQRQAAINQQRQIVDNQIRQRDGVLANVDLNQLQEAEIEQDAQVINLRQIAAVARNNWLNAKQQLDAIIVPRRENWVVQDRGILEFIGNGIITIAEDKNVFGDIRTRVGGAGTVIYEGDRQLQEQIGERNAKLKSVQFFTAGANIQLSTNNIHAINLSLLDAGQTLTVDDNINFAGKITGLGTVDFAGRSTVAQIGEINARVARVRAGTGNVIFNQPIYANIVEINGNSPIRIIDRTLSTNHILLNHQNAQVTVVNGFAAPVAILAAAPGHGRVIFAANGNVGAIGQNGTPVGIVEFQNNAQHTLNDNVYSNNIIFDNGVFTPQNQNIQIVVPQGNINNIPAGWQYVQNALITNARAQQLVQPPVNHNQQLVQLVNQNQQPEPEVVDNQLQELRQNEQNEPRRLELEVVANQPQELVINEQNQRENRIIDIEQPVPQIRYTQVDAEVQQQRVVQIKESLIQATSTIIDTSSNVVVHQDTATKTLVSQLTAPVIQNHKNVEDTIRQLNSMGVTFSKAEAEIAKLDAPIGTKTSEQQALLYVVGMTALSPDERKTTMNRMEEAVQAQIKVAEQVTETIHHTIDNRMNELNFNQPEIMVSSGVGVAAGDEAKRKLQGVWARGIYGVSKQRPDKGSAGYNGNSAGGTIGGDFELNEKNIVGIAYSNIRSGFKYKQSRAGDKTTGNSHILSLYGAHQLNDNFSLKTMLAAGMSKITTKRFIMDKIATGKVKNKSYSAEASLNYKIIANENLYFMPNVGLRYAHYRDGAYSERGVGVYNVSVAAKSNNTLTAITGINMMMPQKLSEALVVVPSVHVAVESYLLNKKQKVKAKLAWMDSYFENNASLGAKSAKFSYNLGGGIVAKYNNMEVSANYNCNLRKKYQNHQGTVKLKILF